MSVNSSFPSNASLSPSLYSSTSIYNHVLDCFKYRRTIFILITLTITITLIILPLCVFILYLGLQRWRQQRSNMMMSHSDAFTYHMVITELMGVLGFTLMCCGVHGGLVPLTVVGFYFFVINFNGQMFFHLLTCVERYLAVVHPVTYLSLKTMNGIRIRNITIGCAWLLSIAGTGLIYVEDPSLALTPYFGALAFSFTTIFVCSLSVLYVLFQPGPGEGGGGRRKQKIDRSKLRAFFTIMAILGVLLIRFGGTMFTRGVYVSEQVGKTERCALWLSFVWFCLPSSLVLPLLFLQRAGRLLCCKEKQ